MHLILRSSAKRRGCLCAGFQSVAEAVHSARGDLRGPCDRAGMEKLEAQGKLGFVIDDSRLLAADVDMALGTAKEGIALTAALDALKDELLSKQLVVHETGFTSCAKESDRCVYPSPRIHWGFS